MIEEHYDALRHQMIEQQLRGRGIHDQRVLEAMRAVPRHLFVPESFRAQAYQDAPLPRWCESRERSAICAGR